WGKAQRKGGGGPLTTIHSPLWKGALPPGRFRFVWPGPPLGCGAQQFPNYLQGFFLGTEMVDRCHLVSSEIVSIQQEDGESCRGKHKEYTNKERPREGIHRGRRTLV